MINLAHRGFSSKYPENTLLAFRQAIEVGADGVELDVQLSKDEVAMIFHDETLNRMTDYQGYLCEHNAADLVNMSIVNSKEKIPTLESLFKYFKDNRQSVMYNIELKNSEIKYNKIERIVIELVKTYNLDNQVIISSFNHESIKRIKSMYPEIKCGILTGSYMVDPVAYIKAIGAEFYHPHLNTLDDVLCKSLNSEGIGITAWTDQTILKEKLNSISKYNLYGLISNYPEKLTNYLVDKQS